MMMTLTMMESQTRKILMMTMMVHSMLLMMMMTMTVLKMMRITTMTMREEMMILTVTISLIQKMPMMMVTVYQIVKMMMMMMLELAPTPSDLVTELPGDLSSLSLRPSFCSSAIENQRRMAKPKSQLFQRNQSPCRHSIMNQTNSLDSPGLTLMYLTNHCTK